MLEISEGSNPNYLCKVVEITNIRKHENADRLQIATVDFQDVITGMNCKRGSIYVYFPVEGKINRDFLSHTNSFRDKDLNKDKNSDNVGFFEDKCRVKAVKLRGHRSMGYIVPISEIADWGGTFDYEVNQEFDTVNGLLLVEKYVIKTKEPRESKKGKKARVSRLVENQFRFHVDTENFRRNAYKINPEDEIEISYKLHGTSFWKSHVLVKRKLSLLERLCKFLGANVQEEEYDQLYGSRRVVKNEYLDDEKRHDHFYGFDLWKLISDNIGEIPKGFTIYGEAVGYTPDGTMIQPDYDYGCPQGEMRLFIYRISYTNPDGVSFELSYDEIFEFCKKYDMLESPRLFYKGKAKDVNFKEAGLLDCLDRDWTEYLVKNLEEEFNDKDCFMCKHVVPEEGICIRKVSLTDVEIYKLKSFRFLEHESSFLDSGKSDIESEN